MQKSMVNAYCMRYHEYLRPPPPPSHNSPGLGGVTFFSRRSYSVFLSSHGGSSNAYTDTEDTVYFFDVGSDHLNGALDRFAQFFIAPQVSHALVQWNQGR